MLVPVYSRLHGLSGYVPITTGAHQVGLPSRAPVRFGLRPTMEFLEARIVLPTVSFLLLMGELVMKRKL